MPRTVVVIPTYKERKNVQRVIPQAVEATDCEVIVDDDASPDGTAKMSKRIAFEALWIVWWLKLERLFGRL